LQELISSDSVRSKCPYPGGSASDLKLIIERIAVAPYICCQSTRLSCKCAAKSGCWRFI